MKIRLEPQKTSLRISKIEFEQLLQDQSLHSSTTFPNGETLAMDVVLAENKKLTFSPGSLTFELPNREIINHKPSKKGLTFYFQLDNKQVHELLFEVDIKKKPLGSRVRE